MLLSNLVVHLVDSIVASPYSYVAFNYLRKNRKALDENNVKVELGHLLVSIAYMLLAQQDLGSILYSWVVSIKEVVLLILSSSYVSYR